MIRLFNTGLLLFSIIYFNGSNFYAQSDYARFERLTVEDGLPENSVVSIIQDHLGFIWFGTLNGLVKYDGYIMKTYLPVANDINSLSASSITALLEDQSGKIWIGTRMYKDGGGLNCMDPATEKFTHYMHNPNDSTSISSNYILCIYQDEAGNLWIGTNRGLSLFNPLNKKFSNYYLLDSTSINTSENTKTSFAQARIGSIIEDKSTGNLLIGSDIEGLWIFDPDKKIFTIYDRINKDTAEIGSIDYFHPAFSSNAFCYTSKEDILIASNNGLFRLNTSTCLLNDYNIFQNLNKETKFNLVSLLEDRSGQIWIGTCGQGVLVLDPSNMIIKQYQNSKININQFPNLIVPTIYEDNTGIIWAGTIHFGLQKWDRKKKQFISYQSGIENTDFTKKRLISSVVEDQKRNLWFGTLGDGLIKYNPKKNTYTRFLHERDNPNSISSNWIYSIVEDPFEPGIIWIAAAGIDKLDSENGTITHLDFNYADNTGIMQDNRLKLYIDSGGSLWAGSEVKGLFEFDRQFSTYKQYRHDPNDITSISQDVVNEIYEDKDGRLWFGTDTQGLNLLDRESGKFTRYRSLLRNGRTSSIIALHEDKEGNFWIGTLRSGLHLFDRETGLSIINFTEEDGLANNYVKAILEDDNNNLWISTEHGLSKFNTQKSTFKNYYMSDGLNQNIFQSFSAFKTRSGEMIFGGINGITIFNPDSIKDNLIPPKVIISNISLLDKSVDAIEYEGYLPELEELVLSYNQNELRFEYVGLHYSVPGKNQYKYKLENFNKNWIDAGTQRNATYTNLDPGEYVFKVIASNSDGIWNEMGASIKIIILPPWWATSWAYIIYSVIILSIIYYTWKLQLRRIRIKQDYEMSKFEAEKMHEVDEMKSRFFANISHEFRTPLTLILGLAAKIGERSKENTSREDALVIKRNANRLHGLVNQLLDLSKLESGKMVLQASPINIIPLLKGLILSFTSYAERKRISLKFNSDREEIIAYVDIDKIEKVLTNLLSNAFKFTPEGGKIEVALSQSTSLSPPGRGIKGVGSYVEISIKDTGIGIPNEMMDKIFDRFYQVDGSHTREQEGTGLGLALTKELVELHKGEIRVESEEGKGTKFIVALPLGKEHLNSEEIIESKVEDCKSIVDEVDFIPDEDSQSLNPGIEIIAGTDKLLLLIVEDNTDVRNYIKGNLEEDFRISEAADGEEGYRKATGCIPDLIISDVMMPKMDGFKMCYKLKTDERTSHIPIIMLTAKATSQDKIEGYETGADDYLMKPFDTKVLRARIDNLIKQRNRLIEHFKREGIFEIDNASVTSTDKIFIKKVIDIINDHISDEFFSVDLLSAEIAISRSQLRRKLVALIGEAPSDLIRRIRLMKAAKLIEQNFGNISEIAAEVGYNNPANFSRSFKSYYGVSPSGYLSSDKH